MHDAVYKDLSAHKELFFGNAKQLVIKHIRFDPFVGKEWFMRGTGNRLGRCASLYSPEGKDLSTVKTMSYCCRFFQASMGICVF